MICEDVPLPANSTDSNASGWLNLTDNLSQSPPQIIAGEMVYDPQGGYDLLFGGETDTYVSDATWTFKNGTWTELLLAVHPPAGYYGSMIWDPLDDCAVLFGGTDGGFPFNGTWIFSNSGWTELHPARAPPARWAPTFAWDSLDGYGVLFGGLDINNRALNDTWSFLHGNWTELNRTGAPSPRVLATLAADPVDGGVVLFGGYNQSGTYSWYSQTWLFHDGIWSEEHPQVSPPARSGQFLAFDAQLGDVILFGGGNNSGTFQDTWGFAAGQWTTVQCATTPNARGVGEMATDPSGGGLLLFGGARNGFFPSQFNDTWVFYTLQLNVSANPPSWEGPAVVTFTASVAYGAPPYSYNISFGDGASSTLARAQHFYPSPGTYEVRVTASDAQNASVSQVFQVTEFSPLVAVGTATPLRGTAPLVVSVSADAASGDAPYHYEWSAPTVVSRNSSNGSVNFPVPGTYTLTLTVHDALGYEVVRTFTVTVEPAPGFTVEITTSATNGSAPLAVEFYSTLAGGTGPFVYAWSLGDGQTAVTPYANATFSAPGSYSVSLSVVDASGVKETATANVSVTRGLALAAFWSVDARVAPLTAQFAAFVSGGTPPYAYLWTFGDGGTGTQVDPVHVYPAVGNYSASVEVVDAVGHRASLPVNISLTVGLAPGPTAPPSGVSLSTVLAVAAIALTATALGATVVLLAAAVTAQRYRNRRR